MLQAVPFVYFAEIARRILESRKIVDQKERRRIIRQALPVQWSAVVFAQKQKTILVVGDLKTV